MIEVCASELSSNPDIIEGFVKKRGVEFLQKEEEVRSRNSHHYSNQLNG